MRCRLRRANPSAPLLVAGVRFVDVYSAKLVCFDGHGRRVYSVGGIMEWIVLEAWIARGLKKT